MRKSLIIILLFAFGAASLPWACIPIEDKLNPQIDSSAVDIAKVYHVQDTIAVRVRFTDNQRLDSFNIRIRKAENASFYDWKADLSKTIIGGRLYLDTVKFFVPANTVSGVYNVYITCYDFSKNRSQEFIKAFEILGDNKPPVVSSFEIKKTRTDPSGNPVFCRADYLQLSGKVYDNIGLSKIEVLILNVLEPKPIDVTGRDTLTFGPTLFGTNIKIPTSVADGTVLELVLNVTDKAGNLTTVRRPFKVECDDQPPVILVTKSSPSIKTDGEVDVIEGTSFRITGGTLSDNRMLNNFSVTFGRLNSRADTVFKLERIRETGPIHFADSLRPLIFKLPTSALAGDIYEVILTASDTARNSSPSKRLLINVLKDEVPSVFITNLYVNNSEVDITSNVSVTAGQLVKIEGKIEEDNALEYVRIFWGPEGSQQRAVDLAASKLTNLPFDFSDPQSVKVFQIPTNTRVGTVYLLTVTVKDTKNKEISKTLRFTVK